MPMDISNKSLKLGLMIGRGAFIGLAGIVGLVLGGPLLAAFCVVGSMLYGKLLINSLVSRLMS